MPFGIFIAFDNLVLWNLLKALVGLDALHKSDGLAGRLMYLSEANFLLS